jgi:rhodanese-related sulfurtransferase
MAGQYTAVRKYGKIRICALISGTHGMLPPMPRQISVDDLARALATAQPLFLLDVRQPWEHETAALPNSVLIPLNELDDRWQEIPTATDALVVAYCHHGIRSLNAAAFLESQGITAVASLAGGIDAWSQRIDPNIPRY